MVRKPHDSETEGRPPGSIRLTDRLLGALAGAFAGAAVMGTRKFVRGYAWEDVYLSMVMAAVGLGALGFFVGFRGFNKAERDRVEFEKWQIRNRRKRRSS